MNNRHRKGRAFFIGFGIALVIALPLVNGCASEDGADPSGPAAEPSSEETAEAMYSAAPVGIWKCHKNLQPRSIVVTPGPFGNNTCTITATELVGSSPMFCGEDGCLPCRYLQDLWGCPTR